MFSEYTPDLSHSPLHARLRRQHELVVEFGVESLKASDADDLFTGACDAAARGLGVDFAAVLKAGEDSGYLILSHGVGWDASDIGTARLGNEKESPGGYALSTDRPVICNSLMHESRFCTPSLFDKHSIIRVINVPIRGTSSPFGVLEASSDAQSEFLDTDVVFLEGLANVISMAVDRINAKREVVAPAHYSESILNASPDCVKIISSEGEIEFFNEAGICRMQIDCPELIIGRRWIDMWPDESKPKVQDAITRAGVGESMRFEAYCPTARDEPRWWEVTVAPIYDKDRVVKKILGVSRDITERHHQEVALASLIDSQNSRISETDLHLAEIHHRVKNSLHLVHTLLMLQGNLATEETVKLQLQSAANRVLAIASVHGQLYQNTEQYCVSAEQYLKALLADISRTSDGRTISLIASALPISSERMAPLGLVISELVTNAIKYGEGAISVSVEKMGDRALISVSDEGAGFPASYPKATGTGLGMRLVKSYAGYGEDAITVDRTARTSTIRVMFRL